MLSFVLSTPSASSAASDRNSCALVNDDILVNKSPRWSVATSIEFLAFILFAASYACRNQNSLSLVDPRKVSKTPCCNNAQKNAYY
jgi:hypothetical protein